MNQNKKKYKYQLTLIYLTIFFILLSRTIAGDKSVDEFKYNLPESIDRFSILTGAIEIKSTAAFPELADKKIDNKNWKHVSRTKSEKKLAGINGNIIVDVFENAGLKLIREFWISSGNSEIATRQKITNKSKETIRLKNLYPLNLEGVEGLVFKKQKDAGKWHVLYQQRLKNGKPASIVPPDTGAIIDPFSVFHANNSDTPDLLIGYLSQGGHLAQFILKFDSTKQGAKFSSLNAKCEFDGIAFPPGAERASQWVYIKTGFDPNKLIAEFADRVGEYHGVKRPADVAPSVFCTWYFHGYNYNERFFNDDIKLLKEDFLPFDVFLIDDCWSTGDWGYWRTTSAFPSGMTKVAETIKKAGYKPGIWAAPYCVEKESDLAKEHPEWLLRTTEDSLISFGYSTVGWLLDPTYPGVTDHIEDVFRRLRNDYGFSYFKLDFMRAVYIYENAKFYNPNVTRLEAYRMGLEAVRKGVGPDAYISVCGGHYGASLGIANSQRSGKDVLSLWIPDQIVAFRQNILRTWMSRLWHVDPDALMIRRREETYHDPKDIYSRLALGKLTDEEALTFTLNQYVGGGMVTFSEYLPELQEDRKDLYKHIIPSINTPSKPLDIYNTFSPSMMLTKVKPLCDDLKPWNTLSIMNLTETSMDGKVVLSDKVLESLNSDKFIVSEFFSGKTLGIFSKGETIDLGVIQPHHSRLVRIAQWGGTLPVLVGTDLHFSGGGVEIEDWKIMKDGSVYGKLNTGWVKPVKITTAFPAFNKRGYELKEEVVNPSQKLFYISNK